MNKVQTQTANCFVKHLYLWILGITAIYTCGDILLTYIQFHKLFYVDTDCYTHATRIIYWLQNFSWYEQIYPYGNYPFGEILHFTRLLDIIWTILALPLIPFFSLKEAIFYSGMALSPLCLALSLIVVFWGLKPFVKQTPKILLFSFILSFAFFTKFNNVFDFNRPDHHSVIFLFFAYNISAVLLNLAKERFRLLFFAGILAGCGIWISSAVEGFIFVAAILGLLFLNWLFNKISLNAIKTYTLGLFIATILAWLLNPPYRGYFSFENTRLSAIHVVITFLIYSSFNTLYWFKLKKISAKIFGTLVCGAVSLTFICYVFNTSIIFASIYDENIKNSFLPYITEMKPLWHFVYLIEMIVFETVLVLMILFYKPQKNHTIEINLAFLFVFFSFLSLFIERFILYELCILAYLNNIFINKLLFKTYKTQNTKYLAFGYICTALFLLASFRYEPLHPMKSEEVPQNSVILTDRFASPQFIFDKNIKTVAIPYHSAVAGIADNHKIFFSTDETEIKRLLQKHQIQYIFLPYRYFSNSQYYIYPDKNIDKFYGKIITGKQIYPWLEKINTGSKDILYKINYQEF